MKAVRNFLGWPFMFIGLFATIVGQARGDELFPTIGAAFLFAGLLAVIALRKRCFSCHKTNNDEAVFCRHCGTNIQATFYRDRVEDFMLDAVSAALVLTHRLRSIRIHLPLRAAGKRP